jgi:hypothetical protein
MAFVMRVLGLFGQRLRRRRVYFSRRRTNCFRNCFRICGDCRCARRIRLVVRQLRQQFLFDRFALFVNLFERRINVVYIGVHVARHHLVADEMEDDFGHA